MINNIFEEINSITSLLLKFNLVVHYNFPVRARNEIVWQDIKNLSVALRNLPYKEKFKEYDTNRNYNFKMIDGALIQLLYEFDHQGENLLKHRLLYYPRPQGFSYEDSPEEYEFSYYGDSEFHDIIDQNIVVTPIRFDFAPQDYRDVVHPITHMHIGEYESCRIPVSGPMLPSHFMNFILRSFYHTAIIDYCQNLTLESKNHLFPKTISRIESRMIHFNFSGNSPASASL